MKYLGVDDRRHSQRRSPHGERELKFKLCAGFSLAFGRSPHGERELKSARADRIPHVQVAPHTGSVS